MLHAGLIADTELGARCSHAQMHMHGPSWARGGLAMQHAWRVTSPRSATGAPSRWHRRRRLQAGGCRAGEVQAEAPNPLDPRLALVVGHEHASAALADALQQLDGVLEVADVEDRQLQLHIACMREEGGRSVLRGGKHGARSR